VGKCCRLGVQGRDAGWRNGAVDDIWPVRQFKIFKNQVWEMVLTRGVTWEGAVRSACKAVTLIGRMGVLTKRLPTLGLTVARIFQIQAWEMVSVRGVT